MAVERAKVMASITDIFNVNLPELTPKSDPELRSRCNFCEKPGKDFCGGCKSARYCSRECQVKDHPLHKLLCKSYAGFGDAQRPSADHVRAILFPATEQKPKLVWCKQKVAKGKTTVYADEHIGRYRETSSILSINQSLRHLDHAETGHGLVAYMETNTPVVGCPLNKSYTALGVPGHLKPRFGNVLFLGTKPDPDPEYVGENVVLDDADLRDYRHALDCLQLHEMNYAAAPPERLATLLTPVATMPALLIHGDGALARWTAFGGPQPAQRYQHLVTRVHVPDLRGQAVGVEQDHAVGARKVGLDWFWRSYALEAHGLAAADVTPAALRNDAVRHLLPSDPVYHADRNKRNQVVYPLTPSTPGPHELVCLAPLPGSLLLLERSGARLEPEHVEALARFLDGAARFHPLYWGPGHRPDDHSELWVSKTEHGPAAAAAAFKRFFAGWKRERAAQGRRVDHLRCPYELRGDVDPAEVFAATAVNKLRRGAEALEREKEKKEKEKKEKEKKEKGEHVQE